MSLIKGALVGLLLAAASAACDGRPALRAAVSRTGADDSTTIDSPAVRAERARSRQDSIVRARPGYVVDSLRPVEEESRRFQRAVGPGPAGFGGGAASRSALVAAFVRALERRDTTALAGLVIDRKEFAFLIYPTSPNARPPYRQAPDIVWLQRSAATDKGAMRLLDRLGGTPLGFVDYACDSAPDRQDRNTIWRGCVVRRATPSSDTVALRLFGPIVERDGRFKFLSLANGL